MWEHRLLLGCFSSHIKMNSRWEESLFMCFNDFSSLYCTPKLLLMSLQWLMSDFLCSHRRLTVFQLMFYSTVCTVVFVAIRRRWKWEAVLCVNIYKPLAAETCPPLLDKPKITIVQACRGGDPHSSVFLRHKQHQHSCILDLKCIKRLSCMLQALLEKKHLDDALWRAHKDFIFFPAPLASLSVALSHPISHLMT